MKITVGLILCMRNDVDRIEKSHSEEQSKFEKNLALPWFINIKANMQLKLTTKIKELQPWKRQVMLFITLLSACIYFQLPSKIVFCNWKWNELVFWSIIILLLMLLLINALSFTKIVSLLFNVAYSLALLLFVGWAIIFFGFPTQRERDFEFEKIVEIPIKNSTISAYRINGSATTTSGVVVRKENIILSGLLFVSNIMSIDETDSLILKKQMDSLYIIDPYTHRTLNVISIK